MDTDKILGKATDGSKDEHRDTTKCNQFEVIDINDEDAKVELVSHTTHHRNWRGIGIALVVIVVVCALIILAIILLTPRTDDSPVKDKFTFEDFISDKYKPKSFHPVWKGDSDVFYYRDEDDAVVRYNCSTNSSYVFMDNTTFKDLEASSYSVSPDELFVLLRYSVEKIYRHTTTAKYKVYQVDTKELISLEGPAGPGLQYVTWSPVGHSLVFIQGNNIYYRPDVTQPSYSHVTTDGIVGEISNGIPDWLYEEEILQTDHALYWSSGGRFLVYATFNDSQVRRYDLTYYGDPSHQYVEDKRISYPKTGTTNPTVRLTIFDTETNDTTNIEPPADFKNTDHYFTRLTWQDQDNVLITWVNRPQNLSIIATCNVHGGSCHDNFWFEAPGGWVDFHKSPLASPDGMNYFLILPKAEGTAGNFRHIAKVNPSYKVDVPAHRYGDKQFVTRGAFDVDSVLAYDKTTETIYYLAYEHDNPTIKHLYRTATNNSDPHFLEPQCISCTIGPQCEWVSASFSDTVNHYMLDCLGPAVPSYSLYTAHQGTHVRTFEDNSKIEEELQKLSLPRSKYVRIPVSDTEAMWGKLLLPESLKEHESIRHKLLMNVYGGPGSQRVTRQFQLGWHEYLASSGGYVIGYADPRGTAGMGDKWLLANYRHLGTTEVEDTLTAGRYFKKLKYVNPKISIWGWSYGGFLTGAVVGQGQDEFSCAMAVAPVTDWRYYDSAYTERYMGLPRADDNLEAYNFANISRYADKFKNTQFLIVHGTGDDNVHFQNTAQLLKSLTEADVYFRTQIYTDQQHSLDVGNTRRHLYKTLEGFLTQQCYGGSNPIHISPEEPTDSNKDGG